MLPSDLHVEAAIAQCFYTVQNGKKHHVFVLITSHAPGGTSPLAVRSSQLSKGKPLSICSIVMQPSTGQTSEHRLQPTQCGSSTRGIRSSGVTLLLLIPPASSFGMGVVESLRAASAETIAGVRVVSGVADARSRWMH